MSKHSTKWAFKVLLLSVSLSIIFSLLSQSIMPTLPPFLSIFVIVFFIFVSVVFDVIAVAFTTIKKKDLEEYKKQKGYETARKLCDHSDKISSFGGDVVGDICGILSGAGGVSLVFNMQIQDENLNLLVTCLVSSLIAGITIFCKAIMKSYSMQNCVKIALKTGVYLESYSFKSKKKEKTQKLNNIKNETKNIKNEKKWKK